MIVLGGTSHPDFLELIRKQLMLPVHPAIILKFANGEIDVDIEISVREKDVFIIQTGFGDINDRIMELLIMIHACKISSAKRVTAVIPYIPYSKQASIPELCDDNDRAHSLGPRRRSIPKLRTEFDTLAQSASTPVEEYSVWPVQTNTVIANMLTTAGADHIITMDLHDPQFQGFFDVPLENLPSLPLMVKCIKQLGLKESEIVLVSPDAGGAKRTAQLSEAIGAEFALVHQDRRTGSHADRNILIGHVKGKIAILLDDIADTCETLINASRVLKEGGAEKIFAFVTHGVFSGKALENLHKSCIDTVFISNTIPQDRAMAFGSTRFQTVDVSCMFAEAMRRLHNGESFSWIYQANAFI